MRKKKFKNIKINVSNWKFESIRRVASKSDFKFRWTIDEEQIDTQSKFLERN